MFKKLFVKEPKDIVFIAIEVYTTKSLSIFTRSLVGRAYSRSEQLPGPEGCTHVVHCTEDDFISIVDYLFEHDLKLVKRKTFGIIYDLIEI